MARFKKAIAALVLGATVVGAAATPAEAARWHGRGGYGHAYRGGYHGYYNRGVSTGAAVGLGLLGVGIGAALASQPRYYGPAPAYGYGAPVYYDDYYAPPPPVYYRSCVSRPMWDPYIGRTVRVETCN